MEKIIRVDSLTYRRFFDPKWLLTLLLCIVQLSLFAQNLKVTGTVTDPYGTTLPGVNIHVKGTTIGTVTDMNGEYSIDVPGDAILVYSSIGYQEKEVEVGNQAVINVELQEAFYDVKEVIVTALGIERKKKALGYSVTEVTSDEITESGNSNPISALAGKVAGINIVQTSAGPSGSSRVIVRGLTEIIGDNQPLYVIDGVPVQNGTLGQAGTYGGYDMGDGLADVNPEDIATISVLKGASASALYGSRAQNGVVMITTKSGGEKKGIGIEVSSSLTFDQIYTHFDTYQTQYGIGANDSLPVNSERALINNVWGQRLDEGISITYVDGIERPYVERDNAVKDFFETGVTNTNNIAFTGGDENTSMRLSISNTSNDDVVPQSGLDRYNVNLRTESKFGKRLRVDAKISYTKEDVYNRPALGDAFNNVGKTISTWGPDIHPSMLENYYQTESGEYVVWTNSSYSPNPYWIIHKTENQSEKNRYIGMLSFDLEIIENLTLNVKGGIDRYDMKFTDFYDINTPNITTGRLTERIHNVQETNLSALLSYNNKIGDEFTYSLSLGGNIMNYNYENITNSGTDAYVAGEMSLTNFAEVITSPYAEQKEIQSVYGFGSLSFRDYLYLDVTARQDWSSALYSFVNNTSADVGYFYPSASLSFLLNEAITLPDLFSFAKARLSWAQIGSDTDPYRTSYTYSYSPRTLDGNGFATIHGDIAPNPYIKPQKTTSVEAGIDVRVLSNRLGLDVAYYSDVTEDMILQIPTDPTSGYSQRIANTGEIKNHGIELLLNSVPIHTKDFRWNLSINFAKNWNEVVELNDDYEEIDIADARWGGVFIRAIEGEEYGQIWGSGYKLDENGERIISSTTHLPQTENKKLGSILPDWTGGLRSNMNYKGVSLGLVFDVRWGGEIYSMTNSQMAGAGTSDITLEGRETSEYIAEGIDEDSGLPNDVAVSPSTYWNHISTNVAEEFVYDASFIKLRELSLGYRIPAKYLDKIKVHGLTVSLIARNFWTLYKDVPNIDPESTYNNGNGQGLEYGSIPTRKHFGFKIGFKL